MKKEQKILLIISVLCALAVLAVGLMMILSQPEKTPSPAGTTGTTETHFNGEHCETPDTTGATQPEETAAEEERVQQPNTDLPSNIIIVPDPDPETGESKGLEFPYQIEGYKLTLEKLAPYKGTFVEDGTNANVEQVAMLMVKNEGDYPIEYTQIAIEIGETKLIFDITALPKGERLVVQEKSCQKLPQGDVTKATALIVQRAELEMAESQIRVTDNGDNSLTVENLTDETIPSTRVFYKYFMKDENLFIGGIAFTVRIRNLGPKEKMVVHPAHYNSTTGRVVMVQTYEE